MAASCEQGMKVTSKSGIGATFEPRKSNGLPSTAIVNMKLLMFEEVIE